MIHRIWTQLPRRTRRSALFRLTALAAAKPSPDARPGEPIIVVGCLRSATGLGQSARLCYEALDAAGLDVYGVDVSSVLMQPLNLSNYIFRDGHSVRGKGTLLIHVNAPLVPLILLTLGRRMIWDKWIVGYWAWELPVVPSEWNVGVPFVHEIWVPSHFVASAVSACVKDVPIHVLPHPVAQTGAAILARRPQSARPFTALSIFDMGSSIERKNPIAAITAFRNAFGDRSDTRMIIKVINSSSYPEGEQRLRAAAAGSTNVTIIDRALQTNQISQMYAESDCLLSLHRSEGFGLTIAEAMLHGVPALSTDWSGPTDFVTEEVGYPVGYQLVPARDPQYTYNYPDQQWAEADTAIASGILLSLRENARGIGESAREDALQRFSADVYAAAVTRFFASQK
jgi:glycosyltransferase involved in cell wall biosynthesis